MTDGAWTALSGLIGQQRLLDVTANNIANASTPGFRGDAVVFKEVLTRANGRTASPSMRYSTIDTISLNRSQGAIETTGRALDVSLPEQGFLAVQTPQGERYTRTGRLEVGSDLVLKGPGGHPVLGANRAPITLPSAAAAANVQISEDGAVSANGAPVGQLLLVEFTDPTALERESPTILRSTAKSGTAQQSTGRLVTESLEASNVSAVKGMVDLVSIGRAFDACQKVLEGMRDAGSRGVSTIITPRG